MEPSQETKTYLCEFVLYWPPNWDPQAMHEERVFEGVMTSVVPELRADGLARQG